MNPPTTRVVRLDGVYALNLKHTYDDGFAEVPAGIDATPVNPTPMDLDQLEQVVARLEHFMDQLMPSILQITNSRDDDNPENNKAVRRYLGFTFLGNSFELTLGVWVHPRHEPAFIEALLDNTLIAIASQLQLELTMPATEHSQMLHDNATMPQTLRDVLAGFEGIDALGAHVLFGSNRSPFRGFSFDIILGSVFGSDPAHRRPSDDEPDRRGRGRRRPR